MICKITGKKIEPFMDFGKMPISNNFIKKENFENEFFFNMKVGFCDDVSLFQLADFPKPEQMFNENYPFFSSSSYFMQLHFEKYANWVIKNFLNSNSKIIEIGSNDGTMLKNFYKMGFDSLGIEPSSNCAEIANNNNIKTIVSFFNDAFSKTLTNHLHNTDAIIAANCICHISDLKEVFLGVERLLSKKGVFIFEEPYLGSMFEKTSYDQIYDEHIFIFSVNAINKISKLFDLELIDVLEQNTHGGSMRYVVGRKNVRTVSKNVENILKREKNLGQDTLESCIKFKLNCEISKKKLVEKIQSIKSRGKKIAGYAATSKSTTVLNYCDIGTNYIDCIFDTTKEKIGKYSPGKHIPIISYDSFYNQLPDYAYLFAWNHKEEIFKKEKEFINKGGRWISHVDI